ncbi:hypothetical protein SAVIM338S_06432 [Streptomyces avidinii]
MIAVLTSGVALGVHVPGLLLSRRLAERGVPVRVHVLEAWWAASDRDRLTRSRDAFQRDFRLALATQRLRRRHDELVSPEARRRIHAEWDRDGVSHFVVLSGFWLPIVGAYARERGGRVTVDTLHLDAVDSPSFTPYADEAGPHRAVRLMDHPSGTLPWTVPVLDAPPVAWGAREDRVLVHGGGWSLGTYREAAGRLTAAGPAIDLVLGSADADPVTTPGDRTRCFRIDPGWNAWDDPGLFPPLRLVAGPPTDGTAAGRADAGSPAWARGDGPAHPSFELTRHARATVSKPGGGSLLDGLWAATPAVLLESFGAHEERNAELWIRLGLGVRMETWQESGHSGELLLGLHRRALELRSRVPDYAAQLARRLAPDGQGPSAARVAPPFPAARDGRMNTEADTDADLEVREVPYAAPDAGSAPLTWSQQDMFRIMRALPGRHVHFNMTFSVRLPAGLSTEQVLDALRDATESHEALRTTVARAADGSPEQQVRATGRIRLRLHHFPRAVGGDALAPDTLEAVADRGRRTQVGYPDEEPYRPDLILVDGAPHTLVLTCNHLTMDGFSVPVLCEDLLGRLTEPPAPDAASGAPATPAPRTARRGGSAPQPPRLRAEFERSAHGSAQSERSVRALERAIRAAPPTPLGPPEDPAAGSGAGFWWGRMRSPALAAALRVLAERYAVPPSAVLVGIAGSLLAGESGAFTVSLITSNRFTARLRGSLGCYFQPVPLTVHTDPADFGATAARTAAAATGAAMNGQFDPRELAALIDRVEAETGGALRPLPVFNVQDCATGPSGLSGEAVRGLLGRSTYEATDLADMEDDGFYLNATARAGTLELVLRTRTDRAPAAFGEAFLRAVEAGAVALVEKDTPVEPLTRAPQPSYSSSSFMRTPGIQFCSCDTHEVPVPAGAKEGAR